LDQLAIPGFIDIQVNGYAGVDFSDPETTPDQVLEVAEDLARMGTIGFLATITTRPREVMETCVATVASAIEREGKRGHILGIHLEGPFISPEHGFRGVHPADAVSPPDLDWFTKLQKLSGGNVRLVTLAPEHETAAQFIEVVARGVVVSAGHTNCSFAQLRKAINAGLTIATHIGNGCRQTLDRHDNPVINLLACSEITLSFISDGIHLPEAFIRALVNSRPPQKLVVVSDSVKFAGLTPGRYTTSSGAEVILSDDGRLCLASEPDIMAGSSATMFKCMNHLASLRVLSEADLWQVGFSNQLRLLGISNERFANRLGNLEYDPVVQRFHILR
jgi:N-acetylglucosamine-6-phosphate deacetylase